jgi:hypothetical protein
MKIALALMAAFAVGCGDETLNPTCQSVHDACAVFHDGTGPGHDCHELAEANDAAKCAAQMSSCLQTCAHDMGVPFFDLSKRD